MNKHLDDYFRENFAATSLVNFIQATTTMSANRFSFGRPVEVDYTTSLEFEASSFIPELETSDLLLENAFQGMALEEFTGDLTSLPVSNIFSSTAEVGFAPILSASARASSIPASLKYTGIAATAAAAAFVIAIAGIAVRQRRQESSAALGKHVDEHLTVAGETYDGSSTCDTTYCNKPVAEVEHGGDLSSVERDEWRDYASATGSIESISRVTEVRAKAQPSATTEIDFTTVRL